MRCGCNVRTGASTDRQLDRKTDTGPIGPLDDFVLRETSPTNGVRRNLADHVPARPAGRAAQSFIPDHSPVAAVRRSRAKVTGPTLTFGTSLMSAPPMADDDGGAPEDCLRGLGRRLAACVVDTTLLLGINLAVIYFTLRLASLSLTEAAQLPLVPLGLFLLFFDTAYLITLTAFGGQTIGKMALGLRVERCGGEPVRLVGAFTRTAAYAISVLPVGLGLAGLFLHRRRALHDLIANTRVVRVS